MEKLRNIELFAKKNYANVCIIVLYIKFFYL